VQRGFFLTLSSSIMTKQKKTVAADS